ncbi:ParH-like protein [Pilimelia terevasa]|uniref:ParH-like protein n=1 Tax=Pilimelia terevasa TaxID=53372 RepID=UPI00166EC2D2|nr:ParH-like protein [Pilimelia terevasa]
MAELDLSLPVPFDPERFCRDLAHRRGRPIHLMPLPRDRTQAPCGLWIGLEDRDIITYDPGQSRLHRDHIIAHETAHMILDHPSQLDPAALSTLLPHLSTRLIRRVLGRHPLMRGPQEREAEQLAAIMLNWGDEGLPVADSAGGGQVRRWTSMFDASRRWHG